jgi:stalled ribosome alternative rescue factor ArfA
MKRLKLPKPKKIRRNPYARALGSPLYRSRAVKGPGTYIRRPKHRKLAEEGE